MVVDYSRFDKIVVSDDELDVEPATKPQGQQPPEEEDEEEEGQQPPEGYEDDEELVFEHELHHETEKAKETPKSVPSQQIQYDIPIKKKNANKLLRAFSVEPAQKPKTSAIPEFKLNFHPQDSRAGLMPVFLTNPYQFKPKKVTVGMDMFKYVNAWGIDPTENDDPFDTRDMMIAGLYGPNRDPKYAQSPEEQFVQVLEDRKIMEIEDYRAEHQANIGRSLVISVQMFAVKPVFTRVLRVPGHLKLNSLHDRVLCPAIGFLRNYHAYVFIDQRDGGQFGPKKSDAMDIMHMYMRYNLKLDDTKYCIGDILRNVGDEVIYEYDLGDRWTFMIRLEAFPNEDGGVELLSGTLGIPPEDSNGCPTEGNRGFQGLLEMKTTDPSAYKKALEKARRANNLSIRPTAYDPFAFDLQEARQRIAEALATKASPSKGSLRYQIGPDSFKKLESKRAKLEPKKIGVCANCGSPDNLKLCGGCSSVRYCSAQCQKSQWAVHKTGCKEKAKK